MALEYTPELIDYRLRSFEEEGKHYVTGFLIGTKVGDKGWGVSRDTINKNVQLFKNKPFIVSPKRFDPSEHFLVGKTLQEQVERQSVVTKGNIVDILGPYDYNDGTDDYYFKFKAHVTDKPVSDALLTGRLPFSTSPYIWPTDTSGVPIDPSTLSPQERSQVKNWIPVHEALVTQGTFGDISRIGKQCLGPEKVCTQALAGSSEEIASYLSSLLGSEKQQTTVMSNENTEKPATDLKTNAGTPNVTYNFAPVKTDEAPKAPETEEKKVEVNEEFETLKKELEAERKTNQKLLTIHKTNVLSNIFTNFESEDVKKEIFKKYIDQDTELLSEFATDYRKYGLSKKELAKLQDNKLAGSSKDEKETFPLAGNSKLNNRLTKEQSLTNLLGGIIS